MQVAESRPVSIRRQAKQQRSKKKVKAILDTTLDMLGGMPSDRITTNEIAKTAGVNIATVYQYFPKKESIYFEIYRRWLGQTLSLLSAVDDRFDGTEGLDAYADAVFECLSSEESINAPGLWKLRIALGSTPDLAALEASHEEKAFRRIIAAQEKFSRKVTPTQARALARLQHHVSISCLYAAAEAADPAERAVLIDWARKTVRFVYDVENLKG